MQAYANRVIAVLGSAFAMYMAVFLLLAFGVLRFGGQVYMGSLLIYLSALVLTFLALSKMRLTWESYQLGPVLRYGYAFAVITAFLFILLHWYVMGAVPLLSAFSSSDLMEIVLIRQRVTENMGFVWNYGSAILMRAVLPFFLFYGFVTRKKVQPLLVIVAFCYSVSLLQKSHIFMVFMPVIIYAVLRRRLLSAALYSGLAVAGVGVLLLATAPEYRSIVTGVTADHAAAADVDQLGGQLSASSVAGHSTPEKIKFLTLVVADRMFLVPGMVAKQWFDLIPAEIPFQSGCGYRFLAPALGCEHYNLPLEIYKKLYPEMVAEGVSGSVNVASFMEDFANWGNVGLFFSGMLLAVLLWLLRCLFAADRVGEVSLNAIPILSLSSAALSTTLLSGGWIAMLFLYYVFRKDLQANDCK